VDDQQPATEEAAERATADLLREAALVLAVMAVLGVVAGFVWAQVVDPALVIRGEDGLGQDELQLGKVFNADGWYVLIGAATGLLAGLVMGLRRDVDMLVAVILLVAGSVVGAAVMAWTGQLFGPEDPTAFLESSRPGASAPAPLEVHAFASYLAWPVGVLAGVLAPLLVKRH
jgi:hypothetical protein